MQFNPRQKHTDGRPSCAIYSRALDEEGPHGIVSGGPLASLPGLLAQAGQGGLRWEGGGGCEGPTRTPPSPPPTALIHHSVAICTICTTFFLHFFFVTYLYIHIYRYIDIYTHLFHLFETINLKKFRKIKSFMMTSPLLLHLKGCPR
ncbi:hypothetical protein PO909_012583 [Leuciscus waleckii]